MILTNRYNLPDQLVKVVESKLYEPHPLGENRFSVTELIGPPLIRTLKAKYWNEITQDVSDFLWMLLGTAVDNILSDFDTDVVAQHKIELAIPTSGKGVIVVGKPDVIRGDTIEDWKCTSVYSFMNNDVKPEWTAQLNCYAYLRDAENVFGSQPLIKHLTINAILRDFVGYKAIERDYPDVAFKCMPVKLWSTDEQGKYIKERLLDHLNNPMRECTPEEKWQKETVYVLRKNGVKKAALASYPGSGGKQKFTSEADLLTIANGKGLTGGKYYVEKRLGECTRCRHYCPVKEMCKYAIGE